jgi:hypothetical protein
MMFRFFGDTYDHERDFGRLKNNVQRVFSRMLDGQWHTTTELQRVGGSAARTRISNLKTAFEMPIESEPTDDKGTLWKYRLILDQVDPDMARRILENDLTEGLKTKLRTAKKEKNSDLRKEIKKLLDQVPDDKLDDLEIAVDRLLQKKAPELDFGDW